MITISPPFAREIFKVNRVYGAEGAKAPAGTYQGNYGFIIQ